MPLTPEQINQIRQAAGRTPLSTSAPGTPIPTQSLTDRVGLQPPAPSTEPTLADKVKNRVSQFTQGLSQTAKGLATPGGGKDVITGTKNIISSAGGAVSDVIKPVGEALISNEKNFGNSLTPAISQVLPDSITGQKALDEAEQVKRENQQRILTKIQEAVAQGKDTTKLVEMLKNTLGEKPTTMKDLLPDTDKTAMQVAGEGAGVALDILSAGSYGKAATGAKTGELLTSVANKTAINTAEQQTIQNIAKQTGKTVAEVTAEQAAQKVAPKALGETLKTIGKNTAIRSGIGAGTGYTYDVSQNLQNGKEGTEALTPGMGTLIGGVVPAAVGGVQAVKAITKETAPKFINSLIKPKQADFAYGKNPGRTVSELGILGNNIEDFGNNLTKEKQKVGEKLGGIYTSPKNSNVVIDASDQIGKIDKAIQQAAKGGKSNQTVVTALQNAKDSLLFEHTIDKDGNIVKVMVDGNPVMRDITKLNPQEAFELKQLVSGQTKFTGNPSDDKTVNKILKQVYGGIKDKLNTELEKNNPEIRKLNEQYADLTSAVLATENRNAIMKRADVISMPIKVGTAGAIISAIATGGAAIPTLLVGAGAAALDKALESTAVKTRIAAWLGGATPGQLAQILQQNPGIKEVLYRAFPKFYSQLGEVGGEKSTE